MRPVIQLRPHQEHACNMMTKYSKGIICAVTGAGKTLIGVQDTMTQFEQNESQTAVVIIPRLLLASQLCSEYLQHIDNASVFHVHSAKTQYESSTNPNKIRKWAESTPGHKLIFTTYHSLRRLIESEIPIDVVHMDEAHNSIRKDFFPYVEKLSQRAKRFYSYTATPKYSTQYNKPGMNWGHVYGQVIVNVSAPDMVNNGFIVSPKIETTRIDSVRDKEYAAERDCMTLLDTILNEDNMQKVLVTVQSTKVMLAMFAETDFMKEVQSYGYDVFWITSKYGAFINHKKVSREEFFLTLKNYGKDPSKKFILMHYMLIGEGLDLPSLTACILMRNLDITSMAQTIGRLVRLHPDDSRRLSEGSLTPGQIEQYKKPHGFIHVPVYKNTGIATAQRLESVADIVFNQGQPAVQTITK